MKHYIFTAQVTCKMSNILHCIMSYSSILFSPKLLLFQELTGLVAKKPLGIPKLGISNTVPYKKPYRAMSKMLVSLTVSLHASYCKIRVSDFLISGGTANGFKQ